MRRLISLLSLLAPVALLAQERDADWGIGLYGSYGIVGAEADVSAERYPEIVSSEGECGSFDRGSGLGGLIQADAFYRITPSTDIAISVGWGRNSGELRYECIDPARIRMPSGELVTAITEHSTSFDPTLIRVGVSGAVGIPGLDPLRTKIGLILTRFDRLAYTTQEKVVTPNSATFDDGTQVRQYSAGFLEEGHSTGVGFTAALEAPLDAGADLRIVPFVATGQDLLGGPESSGLKFRTVRLGIGIERTFGRRDPVVASIPTPPDLPRSADLHLSGSPLRIDQPLRSVTTQNVIYSFRSRIPYLYFHTGTSQFYSRESVESRLPGAPISVDTPIELDEAADSMDRMEDAENPRLRSEPIPSKRNHLAGILDLLRRDSTTQLRVVTSAPEAKNAEERRRLIDARNEAIRLWLVNAGIDPERIILESDLSADPSPRVDLPWQNAELGLVDGASRVQEVWSAGLVNHRVDAWLHAEGIDPSPVRWDLQVRSLTGSDTAFASADYLDSLQQIRLFTSGMGGRYLPAIEFRWEDQVREVRLREVEIQSVNASDTTLLTGAPVGVIYFDFNSAEVHADYDVPLRRMRQMIPAGSRVEVRGFADRGSLVAAEADDLALLRAQRVAERLRREDINVDSGVSNKPKFIDRDMWRIDSESPEYRMHVRRVEISVTPP